MSPATETDIPENLKLFEFGGFILKAYLLSHCVLTIFDASTVIFSHTIFVLKAVLLAVGIIGILCLFTCRTNERFTSRLPFPRLFSSIARAGFNAVSLQGILLICMSYILSCIIGTELADNPEQGDPRGSNLDDNRDLSDEMDWSWSGKEFHSQLPEYSMKDGDADVNGDFTR